MLHIQATVQPDPELTALYDARYAEFKQIYPACRPLFASLAGTVTHPMQKKGAALMKIESVLDPAFACPTARW